jgi:hypothetical protein
MAGSEENVRWAKGRLTGWELQRMMNPVHVRSFDPDATFYQQENARPTGPFGGCNAGDFRV